MTQAKEKQACRGGLGAPKGAYSPQDKQHQERYRQMNQEIEYDVRSAGAGKDAMLNAEEDQRGGAVESKIHGWSEGVEQGCRLDMPQKYVVVLSETIVESPRID
jgi:hypothetical protein